MKPVVCSPAPTYARSSSRTTSIVSVSTVVGPAIQSMVVFRVELP